MSLRSVLLGLAIAGLSCLSGVSADTLLKGTLGNMPITMYQRPHNEVMYGVYFYDRHRTPIRLKPTFVNAEPYYYAFDELDSQGLPVARLRVDSSFYTEKVGPNQVKRTTAGTWQDYRTGKRLRMNLQVMGMLFIDSAEPGPAMPALQAASTKDHYFQVPMTTYRDYVKAVEVMSKKTGLLVQTLVIPGCLYEGIDTVRVVVKQGVERLEVGDKRYCLSPSFTWDAKAGEYRVH
jgi:hypothetical protein